MEESKQKEEQSGQVTLLTPFQHQEAELRKLADDYRNLVVTEQNLKEAEEARLKLWRIRVKEIGKTLKENLETLKGVKTDQEKKAERLSSITQPVEEDLERKISIVKAAKEKREKEEREREANRVRGHNQKLSELSSLTAKINKMMSVEEVNAVDLSWTGEYEAEEFSEAFVTACNNVFSAKAARIELLELRKKEEERKAAEEAKNKTELHYENKFKELTSMLSAINTVEEIEKVEAYIEIAKNEDTTIYGPYSDQATPVLQALGVIAQGRKDFLIKRAHEEVKISPREEVPASDKHEPESQEPVYVPKRPAFGHVSQNYEPQNHIPDINEPEDTHEQVSKDGIEEKLPENPDLNYFTYGNFVVGLSKNVPERAAKSILNYCQHILTK